jgi:hypothetical protein
MPPEELLLELEELEELELLDELELELELTPTPEDEALPPEDEALPPESLDPPHAVNASDVSDANRATQKPAGRARMDFMATFIPCEGDSPRMSRSADRDAARCRRAPTGLPGASSAPQEIVVSVFP